MQRHKIRIGQTIDHFLLILLLLVMVYPLFMAVWCSFKSTAVFNASKWYPTLPLNFENVWFALKELWVYILNTVLVGGVGTLGVLVVSSLAAYAFARMKFFLKNFLYGMVIALMMIPAIMTLVPSFMLYKQLVGTDTYLILIIPIITGGSVFGVFLLRGFFEGVSESIFEAAKMDGAGDLRCYLSICIPLSVPILLTLAIMQLTGTWNDYIWPTMVLPSPQAEQWPLYPIQAALTTIQSIEGVTTGEVMASLVITSVPIFLIYVFAQKYIVEGIGAGGLKI